MRKMIACVVLLVSSVPFSGAQGLFSRTPQGAGLFEAGMPVTIEGNAYFQSGILLNTESLYNGLSFFNAETRVLCGEGKNAGTIGTAMLICSVATLIGGTAVTLVAASGVSDYDGTMSMFATGIGLYLGTAGLAYGSYRFRLRSAEFYRRAVESYNLTLR